MTVPVRTLVEPLLVRTAAPAPLPFREDASTATPPAVMEGIDTPVAMHDVRIGDSILGVDDQYDEIYSFGHYGPNDSVSFVSINRDNTTEDNLLLVHTETGRKTVPASSVSEGDIVVLADNAVAEATRV